MASLVSFPRFTLIKFRGIVLLYLVWIFWFYWVHFGLGLVWGYFTLGFTLGLFKKCGLWYFKVIKQLFLPFTNNRLTISLFSIIFFASALTLFLILLRIFVFVDLIALVVNLLYLSVSIWYKFDVLSAPTKIFFDFFKVWR